MKVEGSAETLGLLETLNIIYTILTRVTFLFLNKNHRIPEFGTAKSSVAYWMALQ